MDISDNRNKFSGQISVPQWLQANDHLILNPCVYHVNFTKQVFTLKQFFFVKSGSVEFLSQRVYCDKMSSGELGDNKNINGKTFGGEMSEILTTKT